MFFSSICDVSVSFFLNVPVLMVQRFVSLNQNTSTDFQIYAL